jgi:deoxyribose-phosphate aldolase
MKRDELARTIDHTALDPRTSARRIRELCEEAREHGFHAVCVNPCYVPTARDLLDASPVRVCTVVGFPLGSSTKETKAFETARAVSEGADEVDMVLWAAALRDGALEPVASEVRAVLSAAEGALVKVILETGLLEPREIGIACEIAADAGADFVKTSTGFGPRGASLEDVAIMKKASQGRVRIKASGGIRDAAAALAFLEAGAHRIGTSSGPEILKGCPS